MSFKNFMPLRRRQPPAAEPIPERDRDERPLSGDKLSMLALWAMLLYRP